MKKKKKFTIPRISLKRLYSENILAASSPHGGDTSKPNNTEPINEGTKLW